MGITSFPLKSSGTSIYEGPSQGMSNKQRVDYTQRFKDKPDRHTRTHYLLHLVKYGGVDGWGFWLTHQVAHARDRPEITKLLGPGVPTRP